MSRILYCSDTGIYHLSEEVQGMDVLDRSTMGLLERRSDPTAVPSTEGKYTRVVPSTRDGRPRGDEAGTLTMFSVVHL